MPRTAIAKLAILEALSNRGKRDHGSLQFKTAKLSMVAQRI